MARVDSLIVKTSAAIVAMTTPRPAEASNPFGTRILVSFIVA
jgi:hypothetical protein